MNNQEKSFFDIDPEDTKIKGLIYLASPYTHVLQEIQELRYSLACRAVKEFTMQGIAVISPIVHCHPISVKYGMPGNYKFWRKYNTVMIGACVALRVLKIPGWYGSKGIEGELIIANNLRIPYETVEFNKEAFSSIDRAWCMPQ